MINICNIFNKKINIKILFLYLLTFYLLYLPDLEFLSPYFKTSYILCFLVIIFTICLRKDFIIFCKNFKSIKYFGLLILANLYTIFITCLNSLNIFSNLTAIVFCIKLVLLIEIYLMICRVYKTTEEKIKFILQVGVLQSIICIAMLIFPWFKSIADFLYINTVPNYTESSVYGITLYRIYGIASDYTFSMSITQALLASISLITFFIYKKKTYIIYVVLLLFSSILNGRTGVILFSLIFIIGLFLVIDKKRRKRIIVFGIVILLCLLIILYLFGGNERISWIMSSFKDIFFIFSPNKSFSTISTLASYVFFPEGLHLIFGYGSRVFGTEGIRLIGKSSDIGFINEIFRGGLIYIFVFYFAIVGLIKDYFYECKKVYGNKFGIFFVIAISIFILLSNYKGEAMSGSSIFLVIIFMFLIILYEKNNE